MYQFTLPHSLRHRLEGSEVNRINYFFIIIYKVIYLEREREYRKGEVEGGEGGGRERPGALSFKLGPASHYLSQTSTHTTLCAKKERRHGGRGKEREGRGKVRGKSSL